MTESAATAAGDAEAGHRNLIAYSRVLTGWGEGGGSHEDAGALALAGGSWLPVGCNCAFRADDAVAATHLVSVADTYFGGRGRGYSVKVRDSGQDEDLRAACEAAGLEAFGDPTPQMLCRQPLPVPELGAGVRLVRVSDADGVADFCAVNAEAYATYGMPDDVLPAMFDRPEVVLADPDTAMVVAYRDDEALAAALVFVGEGTASLQWVGTRPAARQLRLGAAVTVWTTNEAFDRGAPTCTLQASTMGAPLYRALGYETLYTYAEYVRWRAPDPAASPAGGPAADA